MDLINIVKNLSDDKVKLLLLLHDTTSFIKSPEPNKLPYPNTLINPKLELDQEQEEELELELELEQDTITIHTDIDSDGTIDIETIKTIDNTDTDTDIDTDTIVVINNDNNEPTQKLTRGKHRIGVKKKEEELSQHPVAILRRQQYELKKLDENYLLNKAKKAREYRAKKKLEKALELELKNKN
jgi:hypothetical protein